jgi:dihydroorotate dehydrogenase electron transfer subunit
MPIDVAAAVLSNRRLSSDYNVIALGAPAIASETAPGQFVMIKPAAGLDPMLRRPFSVFEVLRDASGQPTGLTLLNKRVGVGTSLLYDAQPGDTLSVVGPLGRSFVPVDAPAEAWMVAGGVGLAPFATLADTLAAKRTPMTLFYGGRSRADLFHEAYFEKLGAKLVLTTEDGTHGERGRVTAPLERALAAHTGGPVTIYACGPTPMMRAVAELGARFSRPTFVSLEPQMGCGMGGCYSCVVRIRHGAAAHFVRSCLEGPIFDASAVVWDELASVGH